MTEPTVAVSGSDPDQGERASVRVVAAARLHLGFLDLEGSLGRRFGSLGLTVEGIAIRVRVERAESATVEGEAEVERSRASSRGGSGDRRKVATAVPSANASCVPEPSPA